MKRAPRQGPLPLPGAPKLELRYTLEFNVAAWLAQFRRDWIKKHGPLPPRKLGP